MLARNVTSSPTFIGSLNTTWSTDSVTAYLPENRDAHEKATRSSKFSNAPPCTFPLKFAMSGVISTVISSLRESFIVWYFLSCSSDNAGNRDKARFIGNQSMIAESSDACLLELRERDRRFATI
jgi:hypothetical protein